MQGGDGALGTIAAIFFMLVMLGLAVFIIAGAWKVFTKAGEPGWFCLIPILNAVIMLKIVGLPMWLIVLAFIPVVNIAWFVVCLIIPFRLAQAFGKSAAFGIGLLLLPWIFVPVLGFGDAQYQGAP